MATTPSEKKTYRAPDISCGHCVQAIQDRLGQMDGVNYVSANAETKLVDVEFDPAVVNAGELEAALADEGYPVEA